MCWRYKKGKDQNNQTTTRKERIKTRGEGHTNAGATKEKRGVGDKLERHTNAREILPTMRYLKRETPNEARTMEAWAMRHNNNPYSQSEDATYGSNIV